MVLHFATSQHDVDAMLFEFGWKTVRCISRFLVQGVGQEFGCRVKIITHLLFFGGTIKMMH